MSFKKEDVLKWMDEQIHAFEVELMPLIDEECGVKIEHIGPFSKEIQMTSESMMELIKFFDNEKLKDRGNNTEYKYELSVNYRGYSFFCLFDEEEYKAYKFLKNK